MDLAGHVKSTAQFPVTLFKMSLSGEEIAKHNNNKDCWVIVHGKAYDVTEFLPEHPGGPKIILKYAGKDATEEYEVCLSPVAQTAAFMRLTPD